MHTGLGNPDKPIYTVTDASNELRIKTKSVLFHDAIGRTLRTGLAKYMGTTQDQWATHPTGVIRPNADARTHLRGDLLQVLLA